MELTAEERVLAAANAFDEAICLRVKAVCGGNLGRLRYLDLETDLERDAPGLCVLAARETVHELVEALQPELTPHGYRAFWSTRHAASGLREGEEVVVLKTVDELEIVRLKGTDGANYGLYNHDVIERLQEWKARCQCEIIGAAHDWVAVKFETLPADIVAFAVEVDAFCPDTIMQGLDLLDEEDDPELFAIARTLCPDEPPAPDPQQKRAATGIELIEQMLQHLPPDQRDMMRAHFEKLYAEQQEQWKPLLELAATSKGAAQPMGIALLAASLQRDKTLFLWWD